MNHGFDQSQISFIKQLISNRNKEVRHEVSDHLDNTLPIKKIRGLGPVPPDGSVPVYDSSQSGGAAWNPVYAVRVRRDAALNIANAAITDLSWDTEERDDGGMWSSGSPTRITFPAAGWYMFGAEGCIGSVVTAQASFAMHVRGYNSAGTSKGYMAIGYTVANPGQRAETIATGLRYFDAGDYITCFPYQVSGYTQAMGVTEDTCVFWAHRLSTP